jgi:hypothetical protein
LDDGDGPDTLAELIPSSRDGGDETGSIEKVQEADNDKFRREHLVLLGGIDPDWWVVLEERKRRCGE